MSDETVVTPGEPQAPQPGENWEARFKGQVRTIEQLTLRNRELEGQLVTKTSELEQSRAQLTAKDTEKNVAVAERDRQIQEAVTAKSSAQTELADLRAYKMKVEAVKKLGRPQLLKILDSIPNMTDEVALNTVIANFGQFADEIAQDREKQLLAGMTPQGGQPKQQANVPSSEAAWNKHIETLGLGTPERAQAFDDYWTWLEAKNK